ncbi:ATP-binding protein [Streptomyces sp. NPDC101733]|uniref:ATP-binding protein n=1 Tax=unclassified Streptomyces TaxID=2593676 RepID=UPI003804F821
MGSSPHGTPHGAGRRGDPNIVEVHVSALRRKLDQPFPERLLHTARAGSTTGSCRRPGPAREGAPASAGLPTGHDHARGRRRGHRRPARRPRGTPRVIRHGLVGSAERTAPARAEAGAEATGRGRPVERLAVPDGEDSLLQVVTDDGRVPAAGENLGGRGPLAAFEPAPGRTSAARNLNLALRPGPGAHPYRLVAVRASGADGRPVTVYAGTSLETARHTRRLILTAMALGIPLLVLLVAAVTRRSTGRALRPVEAIRAEVAEITEKDLDRRVPVPDSRDEVARLSLTMSATLDRLEESMDRRRRFVADASHELRNPLAALRAHVEVAIAHPELLHGPELLDDVVRVQRLADDLLLPARLDAGQTAERVPLDLAETVRATVARRPAGRVPVTVRATGPAPVRGSGGQLARVLDNLLDNAQRHARAEISVSVTCDARGAVLEVCDDGAGVPGEERERILTRFTRLDASRSRDAGGTGLGLTIARDIAAAHGGALSAGSGPGGRFTLRLPADSGV